MGCKICSGLPSVPVVRRGLPTIWEWGPFLDYEEVPAEEIEAFLSAIDEDVE
jgi:uncharacterized Fe-S cluster-containing MiaB family protein